MGRHINRFRHPTAEPEVTVQRGLVGGYVYRGDQHIMSFDQLQGAEAMAAFLEQAVELSKRWHLLSRDEAIAHHRIVGAVASAIGVGLDLDYSSLVYPKEKGGELAPAALPDSDAPVSEAGVERRRRQSDASARGTPEATTNGDVR